jgi:hypothetical protein
LYYFPCFFYLLLSLFVPVPSLPSVALGQVMLYVDGMNGVMEHNPTVQWLYSLIASKYRLVAKTALKLLLVFVEYVESNCQLLVKAIETVDSGQGKPHFAYNILRMLMMTWSSPASLNRLGNRAVTQTTTSRCVQLRHQGYVCSLNNNMCIL